MKASQGNERNEHGWKKWQGRIRPSRTVRELNNPQGDEGADGWTMTKSDFEFRKGSGRPTSTSKPGRF